MPVELTEQAVGPATSQVAGVRDPWPVLVFCCAIFAAAIGIGVVLLVAGAPRPGAAPVLLLALAVAVCVNRFALFPTEQAATAEAAVLLAAVVGFRGGAVFLGPLAVGLLVGPLDALHWQQRSFLRMAHNAGNRGLSALAAAAAFVAVRELVGSGPVALILAVAAAVLCLAIVDVVVSVTLMMLQGASWRAAAQHVVEIDALTVPVAWYGAAAGLLAGELGWWATALAVVPAAFVPEIVLARRRWRGAVVRNVVCVIGLAVVLVAVALVTPVPDAATLAMLVALAVLAGAELSVGARTAVPPLLATVVVAAAIVSDDGRAYLAAALVAIAGTSTTWWMAGPDPVLHRTSRTVSAVAAAAVAGLLAATVFERAPASLPGVALAALAAGVVFEVVAVAVGTERRRALERLLWTVPLLVTASAWAGVWQIAQLGGAALFATATATALVAAAWWGAPPWGSRYLERLTARAAPGRHRAVLAVVCLADAALAVAAMQVRGDDTRPALIWATVGTGTIAIAMALVGVRQWRFAPGPRAGALATLLTATAMLGVGYPALAVDGSAAAVALVIVLMLSVCAVGRTPGSLADASAVAARGRPRARHHDHESIG